MNAANPQIKNLAETEFDKLFYVMLNDEFRELMNFKAHQLMDEKIEFPKTKLDVTVKKWQEVFFFLLILVLFLLFFHQLFFWNL